MIKGTYHESLELAENEWLLKLRETEMYERVGKERKTYKVKTGFFSKLTQKGALPKPFLDWGGSRYGESGSKVPVFVFQETYRPGWKLVSWRFGMSRNWAVMMHPEGFTLEIHMENFLEILKEDVMIQGVLQSEYVWNNNQLLKK